MAKGKLNVYNLGEKGVNVTKDALQLEDNELRKAQNADYDDATGRGALKMRDGLTKVNASALNSGAQVLGSIALPFPYAVTRTIYAAVETGSGVFWRKSTDGTTWTSSVVPARAQKASKISHTSIMANSAMVSYRKKIYYPGDGYIVYPAAGHQPPPIRVWDEETDAILGYVPYNIGVAADSNAVAVLAMCLHKGRIYISTLDGGVAATDARGRVLELDLSTNVMRQIGPTAAIGSTEFDKGWPFALTTHNDRLWVGTSYGNAGSQQGEISWIRPGFDKTWRLDFTLPAGFSVMSMVSYRGELYAGCRATDLTIPPRIYKRAATGVWAMADTGVANSSGYAHYSGLTVFQGNLFALLYDDGVATVQNRIKVRKLEGATATWSTVYTLANGGASRTQHEIGMGLAPGDGAIYMAITEEDAGGVASGDSDGILLRSTNGLAFTEVDVFTNLRGFLGFTII